MPFPVSIRSGLLLLAFIGGAAHASDWKLASGSRLSFEGTQQGEAFNGEFKHFDADLHFDPAALDHDAMDGGGTSPWMDEVEPRPERRPRAASRTVAESKFDVRIQIASVDSANSERDEAMRGGDWFDAAKFPQARFLASHFRRLGDGKYTAEASLELRGHSVAMAFPFTWVTDASGSHLRAKVTLDRLDFGLGAGEWEDEDLIGHQVTVSVNLNLQAIP